MKTQQSKKTGITIITGVINEISEDRTQMSVKTYDSSAKAETVMKVKNENPLDETFEVGKNVFCAGYSAFGPGGQIVNLCNASTENYYCELGGIGFIYGVPSSYKVNEAKTIDYTDKATGEAKTFDAKESIDIRIAAKDALGERALHTVRLTDSPAKSGVSAKTGKPYTIGEKLDCTYYKGKADKLTESVLCFSVNPIDDREFAATKVETKQNGEYTNTYITHFNVSPEMRFCDISRDNTKQKENTKAAAPKEAKEVPTTPAPAPAKPEPAPTKTEVPAPVNESADKELAELPDDYELA